MWLLKIATRKRRARNVRLSHLRDSIVTKDSDLSEHVRDAALGAFAAAAMLQPSGLWRDLAREEPELFAPVSPVEYWMPIGETNPRT